MLSDEMETVIEVSNLSKRYRLKHSLRPAYSTLRDVLSHQLRRLLQHSDDEIVNSVSQEDFWALRDVSFTVSRGEAVGIIGRNGAGKSTLLKILCRITEPTTGCVTLNGRVASLLEVGTGFHPELTGRENIFLNGAILGMSKKEIRAKFDDIVSFAEVAKFLDTPVKHYSSGMYVRLAFAVAAHLEPEILIVDEVLAVGDVEFQKRCLGKMKEVAKAGRTVLFVSHNLQAVTQFCQTAIVLKGGCVHAAGEATAIVSSYLANIGSDLPHEIQAQISQLPMDPVFRLIDVRTANGDGSDATSENYLSSQPVLLELDYELLNPSRNLWIGFDLLSSDGAVLMRSHDDDATLQSRLAGHYKSTCSIPAGLLMPGQYTVNILVAVHPERWIIQGTVSIKFSVIQLDGINPLYISQHRRPGYIQPVLPWCVTQL